MLFADVVGETTSRNPGSEAGALEEEANNEVKSDVAKTACESMAVIRIKLIPANLLGVRRSGCCYSTIVGGGSGGVCQDAACLLDQR